MILLADFLEDVSFPNGEKYKAYCMDGSEKSPKIPDMRWHVGLGPCSCCDYFLIRENKIVIIEEKDVMWREKNLKKEYSYLRNDHLYKFITKSLRLEIYAKVYGSLLVLCRLTKMCEEAAELMKDKQYDVWFVGKMMKSEERHLDNFGSQLRGDICSVLPKIIDKVQIIPRN